ncbi:MAG: lysylphosphatidylglycerol synthase domain-containing protein [Elusimicrobiota bacterium]
MKTVRFIKFALPWAVTAAVFAILLRGIPGGDILAAMAQANPALVLLALGLSAAAALYAGVEKYRAILDRLGCRLPAAAVRSLRLGTLPLKIVFPFKSGELLRAVYLNKEHRLSYTKGVSSIALNYLGRFGALALIVLLGAALQYLGAVAAAALAAAGLAAVCLLRGTTVRIVVHSMILELCLLANFILVFKALGISLPAASLLILAPLAMMAASLPLSVSGLGVREGAVLLLFSGAAPAETLFAAGLIVSMVNGLFPAVLGTYFMQPFLMHVLFGAEAEEGASLSYLKKRRENPILRYRIGKRTEKVLEAIRANKGGKGLELLDVGAADGEMLSALRAGLELGRAVGVEPSPELRAAQTDAGIRILEGVGESLPFGEGEFDVVVIASAIEHMNDAAKVIAESYRVLRRDGLLVITAVDPILDKVAAYTGFKPDDHNRNFSLKELRSMLTESSFQVRTTERFGPLFYGLVVGAKGVK